MMEAKNYILKQLELIIPVSLAAIFLNWMLNV